MCSFTLHVSSSLLAIYGREGNRVLYLSMAVEVAENRTKEAGRNRIVAIISVGSHQ